MPEDDEAVAFLWELVDQVSQDEGQGGFSLWADIDGYEWLEQVELFLKKREAAGAVP